MAGQGHLLHNLKKKSILSVEQALLVYTCSFMAKLAL